MGVGVIGQGAGEALHHLNPKMVQDRPTVRPGVEATDPGAHPLGQSGQAGLQVGQVVHPGLEAGDRHRDRVDVRPEAARAHALSFHHGGAAPDERVENRVAGQVDAVLVGTPEIAVGRQARRDEQGAEGGPESPGEPLVRAVHRAGPLPFAKGEHGEIGHGERSRLEHRGPTRFRRHPECRRWIFGSCLLSPHRVLRRRIPCAEADADRSHLQTMNRKPLVWKTPMFGSAIGRPERGARLRGVAQAARRGRTSLEVPASLLHGKCFRLGKLVQFASPAHSAACK